MEQQQQQFLQTINDLGDSLIKAGEQMQSNAMRYWFDAQRQALMAKDMTDAFAQMASQPELVQKFQAELQQSIDFSNAHAEIKTDRRFKDEAWQQPGFAELAAMYLNYSKATQKLFDSVENLDNQTKERVSFFVRQWLSAISPSNFMNSNPVVLNEIQNTGGINLFKGMQNYLDDLKRGNGFSNIKMTDLNAFKPGKNLAVTPGKVVFQNKLMQLIQYTATTAKVSKKPILIVPPWINKYYILDLKPENSLVKWLVDQGHTVFMISWVNPDRSHAQLDFSDYVEQGVLAAVDAIEEQTSGAPINALGYCLGGTLLGTTLAYMKAQGDTRIASATFFTTLLDFTYPGELGCFLSAEQLNILDQQMQSEGVLDGRALALAYNMLRENDLHWSYHVNNYLLGKEPPAFDLLYWNSDATNLPAAMHHFYLKNMYLENRLKDPGGIEIKGVAIDISKIDIPCYFLSAQKDHIALWESTYLGALKLSGNVTFVLAGSGHVAGVINPADSGKYSYFINDRLASTSSEWLQTAKEQSGSWWPNWNEWLNQDNPKVTARKPEKGSLTVLEDAPGSYVLKTLN